MIRVDTMLKKAAKPKLKRGEAFLKKTTTGLLALLACVSLLIGCAKGTNIFGWAAPTGGSAAASKADGNAKFAAGDWAGALVSYKAAVDADPADSEARYNNVKAYCKSAGLDLSTFLTDFSTINGALAFKGDLVRFSPYAMNAGDYMLIEEPDKMLGLNLLQLEALITHIIDYLGPIAAGACDGVIPSNSVGLNMNLAFAHMLRGMFYVFDTGLDGTLNYNILYKKSDGKLHIFPVNSFNLPNGAEIKTPTTVFDSTKGLAKSELNSAIININAAISWSVDGPSALWISLKNVLLDVQSKVNTL